MTPFEDRYKAYLNQLRPTTKNEHTLFEQLAAVHSWLTSFERILAPRDAAIARTIRNAIAPDCPRLREFFGGRRRRRASP